MKTTLCFIRHGETKWNNQRRIQGRINNLLNENGIKQARLLGHYLKENNPNWDLIISSPLSRAYDTAKIILEELSLPIEIIVKEAFIEREFGNAEGEKITQDIYDKIINDDVENLETTTDLQNRVYQGVLNLAKEFPGKKILVVAHSHVIKGLLTKLDNKYSFTDEMQNSSLNYFSIENNNITIEKVNINTHLQ